MIFKWFNTLRVRTGLGKQPTQSHTYRSQWAKDYQLVAWGSEALFGEYLEMGNLFTFSISRSLELLIQINFL